MDPVREIDTATLKQWMDEGRNIRLIDVRSPMETGRGLIAGSELLPLHLLPLKMIEVAEGISGDNPAVFVCRTGARSFQAAAFLTQHGFTDVYNLKGGVFAWVSSGNTLGTPNYSNAA
ncbi:MAG: rhodanese-like domain-containing protein [Gammaproteobacteria bacterium]|jgi:rhodanese-related sulfurtransferase|nr:rhodanese-like domain-containing protein [Gammaproteobacteria bacterium]